MVDRVMASSSLSYFVLIFFFFVAVCFKIFDFDRDGLLSKSEIEQMCKSLLDIRRESRINQEIVSCWMNFSDSLKGIIK